MEDFKKIVIFIGFMFLTLISLTILGNSKKSVLSNYSPIQEVRATNDFDTEEIYLEYIECSISERVKKPYVLTTISEETSYGSEPTFKTVDYGTYKEIDSLKCLRYKQMQWKMYHLDKLNEKSCE